MPIKHCRQDLLVILRHILEIYKYILKAYFMNIFEKITLARQMYVSSHLLRIINTLKYYLICWIILKISFICITWQNCILIFANKLKQNQYMSTLWHYLFLITTWVRYYSAAKYFDISSRFSRTRQNFKKRVLLIKTNQSQLIVTTFVSHDIKRFFYTERTFLNKKK